MDHLPQRSDAALIRQATTTRKGRKKPSNLREQVDKRTMMMWPTPTTETTMRKKKYAQGGTPLTLAVQMWPTPTVGCVEGGEQSDRVERTDKGGFILRKKNKPHMTYGAKLSDAILFEEKQKILQGTGTLNPTWVEWLMGYPIGWTDLED
jgi:hypothetical protein